MSFLKIQLYINNTELSIRTCNFSVMVTRACNKTHQILIRNLIAAFNTMPFSTFLFQYRKFPEVFRKTKDSLFKQSKRYAMMGRSLGSGSRGTAPLTRPKCARLQGQGQEAPSGTLKVRQTADSF